MRINKEALSEDNAYKVANTTRIMYYQVIPGNLSGKLYIMVIGYNNICT